jgi:hypothetical protein
MFERVRSLFPNSTAATQAGQRLKSMGVIK